MNPRSLRNGRRTTIGRKREKRKYQKEKMIDVAERDREDTDKDDLHEEKQTQFSKIEVA